MCETCGCGDPRDRPGRRARSHPGRQRRAGPPQPRALRCAWRHGGEPHGIAGRRQDCPARGDGGRGRRPAHRRARGRPRHRSRRRTARGRRAFRRYRSPPATPVTSMRGWCTTRCTVFRGHDFEFLFIENVGNLVCPAMYDLGQIANVVVLSVTEGEDKPLKYPVMFRTADLVVLTKIDLLPHLPRERRRHRRCARARHALAGADEGVGRHGRGHRPVARLARATATPASGVMRMQDAGCRRPADRDARRTCGLKPTPVEARLKPGTTRGDALVKPRH